MVRAFGRWLLWLVLAGLALQLYFLAGIALMLLAVATFRRAGTSPNPTVATSALAVEGPYRFTRNPMYAGLAVVHLGAALLLRAPLALALLPVVLAVVQVLVIRPEEEHLAARFPGEYASYRSRVRRWL